MAAALRVLLFLVAALQAVSVVDASCDEFFNNTTGMITNPSTDPGTGKNCTYKIVTETANAVTLIFENLFLEAGTDTLTIYSGIQDASPVVVNFTQHTGPEFVVVPGKEAKIVYLRGTQNTTTAKFSIKYDNEKCERSYTGNQGILKSPIYLNGTGTFKCTYTIMVPTEVSSVPVLAFPSLNLPAGNVEVLFNQTKQANVTGTNQPDDVVFPAGGVNIVLVLSVQNDSRVQNFSAQYQYVDAACSGKISVDKSDTLTSLSLPSATPFPVACYWQFVAKDNASRVYMVAELGQLAGSDSILLYDGGSVYGQVIGGANQGLPWFVSSGQKLTVMAYLSQTSRTDTLKYKQDKFSGLYMLDKTGKPTDPVTLKGSDVAGKNVSLQFLADTATSQVRINVATTSKLTNTKVQILDCHGNVFMTFGKESQLFPVRVTESRALVVVSNLTADDTVSLTAQAVSADDCNQLYQDDTGLITAKSYTKQNRSCTVAVTSAKASVLSLSSISLCKDQTVEVYAGLTAAAPKVATLSGSCSSPSQIHFAYNAAPRLAWKDTANATGCGTTLLTGSYSPQDTAGSCGTLEAGATSGSIQTPGYPNQYPLNFDCAWGFPSANNTFLYLTFNSVKLAEKHTVTIKNGSTPLTTFSVNTTTLPDDQIYSTNSDKISVAFSSAVSNADTLETTAQGLSMGYKILNCGGNVNQASSKFSSPAVTNTSVECIWKIQVAATGANQSVNVVAVNISAAGWINSSSGSLSLYDGGSMKNQLISVNLTAGKIRTYSTHNILTLQYVVNVLKSQQPGSGPQAVNPFTFNLTYATHNCPHTLEGMCRNGDCMLPSWRCNGKIECPDGSDEIGCKAPPPTTPSPTSPAPPGPPGKKTGNKGVAAYWVFICLVIGLVLGVFVTLLIPKMVRKWRLRSYTGGPNNYGSLHEDT